MTETLHPDVYIQEVAGVPTIQGVSTSTAAFVGQALKGPTTTVGFVSSYPDFVRQYGEGYPNGYLEDAVFGFFGNGGVRAFISRTVGAGAEAAVLTTNSLGGAPTSGVLVSGNAQPFVLASGQTLLVVIDGAGPQTFTFTGVRAVKAGSSPTLPPAGSSTLLVTIDGFAESVTFAGTETTPALAIAAINAQINHGRAILNAGNIDLEGDIKGTAGSVHVTGGTANAAIGQAVAGAVSGTGNVPNIEAVQVADALSVLSAITGATATNNGAGHLEITSATSGTSSTVQVTGGSTAVGFGFSNTTQAGTTAGASAPFFTFTELYVGADGNNVTVATQRYAVATTASILNGATTAVLNDVTAVQKGDVVTISDGTTKVVVHIYSINVGSKTITFQPVAIGATIASGASVTCDTSHRAQTTLALSGFSADTIITVTSTSQMHVGTLLSIDDGTTLIFRTVTKVNGNQLTLNGTLGAGIASGTLVVTQSVDVTVKYLGTVDKIHQFISWEPTDQIDWIEVRMNGNGNESNYVEAISLNPSIAVDLNNRPASITDTLLTGGDDGSTPGDNDFIGSSVVPKSGLYLFDDVKSINLIAIPGVTTQAVQQALLDYATLRMDIFAVGDPPLADDQPLEVIDYSQNVINRDTSYGSLYYPWLIVTDRHAAVGVQNPQKSIPPCGHVMGLMALVDAQQNVSVAPANMPLLNVISLTHFTSDGEHDLLNPIGINVIRTFPGEGIKVMGARTLSKTFDGRQYVNVRRLLLYIENSLKTGLRSIIFKPIDPKTFRKVTRLVKGFLGGIWKEGMLFPTNDFKSAQFVKCDGDNNPTETRTQGKLYLDVGVNPPLPAEFVIARIGVFDGSTSVQEIVQNR